MTFDLFADPEPIAAPTPALAPSPAVESLYKKLSETSPFDRFLPPSRAEREAFVLTPTGEPNRWTYKGEIVLYDAKKLAVAGRGRWSTVEGIGKPEVRGFSHVEVCRAIDAFLAAH